VTEHNPLADRIEPRLDAMARQMVDAFVERIPQYATLPREQLDGEILPISRHNLSLFVAYLRTGDTASLDLDRVRASAARRAEEQVPLEALLTAYQLGAAVGWQALRDAAGPDESQLLIEGAGRVMEFLHLVTGAFASAYLEERQAIYGEARDARRTLAEALLTGAQSEALAQRASVELASHYVVLAIQVEASPDEATEGVEASVAARRKQRRVDEQVPHAAGPHAVALIVPTGGTVLVPTDERGASAAVDADEITVKLAESAGAAVHAGVSSPASIDALRDAAAEAREVLRLVLELGRPPGAYTVDSVVLEYLLTRPSAARDRLASVLDPLEAGPELIATLEGWFGADFDRRSAAEALAVHPNTLDYRLRRIGEITGLSLSTARGLQVLGAALAVRRLRGR
jgi:sugar diacid utilization regulator